MATLQETMAITDRISGPMLAAMNSIQSVLNVFGRLDTQLSAGVSTEFANEIHAAAERSQRDINNLAATFAGLSDTPVSTPRISTPFIPQIPEWQTGGSNEWLSDRWGQQISAVTTGLSKIAEMQDAITTKAAASDVLDPRAQYDIGNVENRLVDMRTLIERVNNSQLNIGTEEATRRMSDIRTRVEQIYSLSGSLDIAIDAGNVSQANAAFLELDENISNVINSARELLRQPMINPIERQSDTNLEVFNTTGIQRYQQEIARANALTSQLATAQNSLVHQNSAFTNILPPNAVADMTRMNERIGQIQQRIQQLNARPANVITDAEIREVEQLSQQLNQALQIERQMTAAAQNMDVSAANAAYQQLSQTIGNAERMLRDNTFEQRNFNDQIRNSQSEMDKLTGFIKKAVGAFVSLQTAKKVIDISDQMTSTTARLSLLVDDGGSAAETQKKVDELQNKIFNSAQAARGSFNDMASFVARVGNNAGKAFTNNDELIKFAELVQKEFTISGASVTEAQNASIQLSQALGAGVLRGQDLNSVFSQAPELIKTIAKGLDIDIGQIRSLAAEGEITAQQVKNAILGAAGDIDKKFNNMPMTWGQAWQSMKNSALMAFKPVLQNINAIVNTDDFKNNTNKIIGSLSSIADIAVGAIKPIGGILSNVISIISKILNVLKPVFSIITEIAEFIEENTDFISGLIDNITEGIGGIFTVLEPVVNFMLSAAQGIIDNWSLISPILMTTAAALGIYGAAMLGVKAVELGAQAATMAHAFAQSILNGTLFACPIFWLVAGIAAFIGIIGIATKAVNDAYGLSLSFSGMIGGSIMTVLSGLGNMVIMIYNIVVEVVLALWNAIANFVNFFANVWTDPLGSVVRLFTNVFDNILSIIETVFSAVGSLFGVDWSSGIQGFRDRLQSAVEQQYGTGRFNVMVDEKAASLDYINYGEAFDTGYYLGNKISKPADYANEINNVLGKSENFGGQFSGYDISNNVADIADNTKEAADKLDISEEDLKYLRDIAERDVINRFTTAEISVNMGGITQTVNERSDLDGIIDYLAEGVRESMATAAEGVH